MGRLIQREPSHKVPARHLRVESLEPRRVLAATAAEAINLFAGDAYEHLQHEEGNLFFSPLSVSTALSMTALGAAGQTAAEMQDVLHLGSDPAIHDSFRELLVSTLVRSIQTDGFELMVANAIWPEEGLTLDPTYTDAVATNYFGQAENVDYSNPLLAEQTINDWVSARTNGQIDDLVSNLTPDVVMVLTNTAYFESLWNRPFDPRWTETGSFTTADGGSVSVPLMNTDATAARTQIDGFDVLELPFVGGVASMLLAMPLQPGTSNELPRQTLDSIEAWAAAEPMGELMQVRLPNFTTTVETKLNDLLAGLGMPTAFGTGADFSAAIPSGGVHIAKVFHKATVEVTEQGTVAAAATEVDLAICFAGGTPVLTPEGPRAIEQLAVGDLVLARAEHQADGPLEPKRIEQVSRGESAVLELRVGGHSVRVTAPHKFFVVGRGWVPAGDLVVGDRLATDNADGAEVQRVRELDGSVPVFNLRVADHRTYFVGEDSWGFAVWTHNFYDTGYYVDRPFHFMIRDNVTDAIAFMGRIDDPTQLENEVNPTVVVDETIPGDFNADGFVNGTDYSVWQAAFGEIGTGLAADANGDGRVDTADYTVWRDNLGNVVASSGSVDEPEQAIEAADMVPIIGQNPTTLNRTVAGRARVGSLRAATATPPRDTLLLLAEATLRTAGHKPVSKTLDEAEPEACEAGEIDTNPFEGLIL